MRNPLATMGRITAGILLLFGATILGGYVGTALYPDSPRINKMEMLADKSGSSVAVLAVALIIRRYILRSFGLALLCLAAAELVALFIIISISGLTELTFSDLRFNVWWLYAITWNVVVAFLIGTVAGQFWDNWAGTKAAGPNHGPAAP